MTLTAIFLSLSFALLATSTPLQPVNPQLLSPSLSTLNLTNPNTTTFTAKAHCFVQPDYPGARTLYGTSFDDCHAALNLMLDGKALSTPYIFGRSPDAAVRLPYAKAFATCKIIIDLMDETETDRLTWLEIGQTLEGRKGILRNCLGQGRLPPLGGRTSLGEKGAMQAIVVGQALMVGAVE